MFSQRLIAALQQAKNIAVLTGAGISAESGVPTFRGTDGIWKKFKPEELASFDGFIRNPGLVWEWYTYRRELISSTQPNPGHYALAEMERRHEHVAVITQNIDNLHRRAGSRTVYELHGNIGRNYCIDCGAAVSDGELLLQNGAPRCPRCNGLVRPDVVWFGELLPADAWAASVEAARHAELFFAVGTSAVVFPAASLPAMAKEAGAYLVEINIERTEMSPMADEVLIGTSGELLPRLLQSYHSLVH
jgi:NAD-dependent deacetylase